MNTPSAIVRRRARTQHGFALLVTIVLVAFLVLILVGLASFTRVETQVASNNQQVAQARQNALMALNIALGQLQKHTGPDQRVTATADLQPLATVAVPAPYPDIDPASGFSLSGDTSTVLSNIDNYWRASRNRRWTGVWRNTNESLFNPESPAAFNSIPNTTPVWLVSGNEAVANTYRPTDFVTGLTPTSTATDVILDAQGRPHRLLVKASARVTDAASLDRAVTAPQVRVFSNEVAGTDGTPTPVGHYAWWIGDEGVKARANLVDPYAADTTAEANRARVRTAQRLAIEAMTTNGTDGLATTYPVNNEDLLSVLTPAQLAYLSPATTFPDELKHRFHDISVVSSGVLADVKNGGLKADLTYLLSRPNVAAFRTALNTVYDTAIATAPIFNPVLSPLSTPRVGKPAYFEVEPVSGPTPANVDLFTYSATWEQLWSFHNMGNSTAETPAGVFDAVTGHAVPRLHAGAQHGLSPLVIQAKLFYRLRIVGGAAVPEPEPNSDILVNRTGLIHIDVVPMIVLANPYNVTLAESDYILAYTGGASNVMRLRAGSPADPNAPTVNEFRPGDADPPGAGVSVGTPLENSGLGSLRIRIKSPAIEPGQALVFSLENPSTEIPFANTNSDAEKALQRALSVNMIPGFLPHHFLSYNTNLTIPAGRTHVVLMPSSAVLGLKLYTDAFTEALGDQTMIRSFTPRTFQEENAGQVFIVEPVSEGSKNGGGLDAYVFDATFGAGLYADPTVHTNPTAAITRQDQLGIFAQLNYRALTVADAASTSFEPTGRDIARSWARNRIKGGSSAGSASFNPYLASHLLFDGGSLERVRWGIYNNGTGNEGDQVPPQLAGDAGLTNILYDIPRAAHPLSSLGQLQHLNLAAHIPASYGAGTRNSYVMRALGYQNNYPVGNSYPNALLNRERLMDYDLGMSFQHDGSYLWNDALADRFFFSTYPQTAPFSFAAGTLANSRLKPRRASASVSVDEPALYRGDGNPATVANVRLAATNLLLEGAFNVNSTSVDAWKALFSSLKDIPIGAETAAANITAPFARTLYQTGGYSDMVNGESKAGNTVNAWTGTVNLDRDQINDLAEEMVLQIRKRGPFLSMADFTNRRLIAKAADTLGIGLSGALQSAIDRVVNQTTDVHPDLRTKTRSRAQGNRRIPDDDARMPTGISGYPGYLLQGDVLSSLGAGLSARSDTFVIRTYGDALNPATGDVAGRAWCEAIVQRTPDYVDPIANQPHETPAASTPNAEFGRRYQIIGFRWLSPEDI